MPSIYIQTAEHFVNTTPGASRPSTSPSDKCQVWRLRNCKTPSQEHPSSFVEDRPCIRMAVIAHRPHLKTLKHLHQHPDQHSHQHSHTSALTYQHSHTFTSSSLPTSHLPTHLT